MGWDGQTLQDFPKMDIIRKDRPISEMMMTAMNLEKAAQRFYEMIFKDHSDQPYADMIKTLSLAEEAHAKTIYAYWQRTQTEPQSFEMLYTGLDDGVSAGCVALRKFDTLPSMHSAMALYRSMGFQQIPPYYHNPFPDAQYLSLRLDPIENE